MLVRPVPAEVQVILFALRYGRSGPRLLDELPKLRPTIGQLLRRDHGRLVVGAFFVYMRRVSKVSEAEIQMALQDSLEPLLDPELASLWEQFEAGERKDKLEGERAFLQRQLVQRFGELPKTALARITSAAFNDLEAMSLRVLTAATLDEVLGTPVSAS